MTKRLRNGQLAKHKREIEDGTTTGKEDLMEAMVAACAAIAFADGNLDIRERRGMFTLIQTHPSFAGFSHADVAVEFERNKTAFEEDPEMARREAFRAIRSLKASAAEAYFILEACRQVLEADGWPILRNSPRSQRFAQRCRQTKFRSGGPFNIGCDRHLWLICGVRTSSK